ncbi:MAG: hypothetical protein M0Q88_05915 [Bacilli bacterium]|nr:hypothetical protein [Bacilli bacterium]
MKKYISLFLIFILLFSLNITSLAAKVYKNDAEYNNAINEQKKAYDEAKRNGDTAGMKAANAAANAIREANGQKASSDGSSDERYKQTMLKELEKANPEAHKQISQTLASGGKVYVEFKDDGSQEYTIPPRTTRTEEREYVTEMSPRERELVTGKIPSSNVSGTTVNSQLFIEKGIIAFGDPSKIPGNTKDPKTGEWRYNGYDINGNLYTNEKFLPDADSGRDANQKNWLSIDQISTNQSAKNLIGYNSRTSDFTQKQIDDANKLLQNPQFKGMTVEDILKNFVHTQESSEYGQGSFVGVHKDSNGKLWYQSFTVPSEPYEIITYIETTIPGLKFKIEGPKPPDDKGTENGNDNNGGNNGGNTKPPTKPEEPTEPTKPPTKPEEPTEPTKPPTTPKEPEKPAKTGIGTITIQYRCAKHGVFDTDTVSMQIMEGKNYNITIPAKNFHPVHKLVDAPEKNVVLNFNNYNVTVVFNYEDYYAIPRMSGVVRPHKMKSGYGFEVEANYVLDTNFDISEIKGNLTGTVEFLGQTYALEKQPGSTNVYASFKLPYNPNSLIQARKIYTPVELKDGIYKATITIKGTTYPLNNSLSIQDVIDVEIKGHMYEDDYTKPKN